MKVCKQSATIPPLPPEGIFIGSGAIDHVPGLVMTGANFTKWHPNGPRIREIIDLCKRDGVGNTLQFWWRSDEEVLELAKAAAEAGIYVTFIYCDAKPEIAERLIPELGNRYLGYDYGEHFSRSLYDSEKDSWEHPPTLRTLADRYVAEVEEFVGERKHRRVHRGFVHVHAIRGLFSGWRGWRSKAGGRS